MNHIQNMERINNNGHKQSATIPTIGRYVQQLSFNRLRKADQCAQMAESWDLHDFYMLSEPDPTKLETPKP